MEICYINSRNQKIDFTKHPYKMLAVNSLFDYSWDYSTKAYNNSKINQFSKEMANKSFDINIGTSNKFEFQKAISHLNSVFDYDVRSLSHGKLYVGNSYLKCYVVQSQKGGRYVNTKHSMVSFTVVAEKGMWVEEIRNSYFSGIEIGTEGLKYPYKYPYNYADNLIKNNVINNTGYVPSGFEIRIYGSAINPAIYIADHEYSMDIELDTGEYLVINSVDKKIYKVAIDGTEVNMFSERNRESYIFEKIPEGISSVAWNGLFNFDVDLLIERSEPSWN